MTPLDSDEFTASAGVPAVHAIAFGPPAEFWRPDSSGSSLKKETTDGKPVRTRATRERDVVFRTARHCLDEIAALYVLRSPQPDKPWTHPAETEARMLRAFDALASLAVRRSAFSSEGGRASLDLVRVVLDHAADAPTLDEGRLFARALVLGSVHGVEPSTYAVRATAESPVEARDAECLGYALASSSHVASALRPLLTADDASLVRLALLALAFRREIDADATVPLLSHPDPGVSEAAAIALGRLSQPSAAPIGALEGLLTGESDDAVALAAAESLLRLGIPHGIDFVRNRLVDDNEAVGVLSDPMQLRYLGLLAACGVPTDAQILLDGVRGRTAAVSALGWHGSRDLVEPLIGILATGNRFRKGSAPVPWKLELAAAEALYRITGAPLYRAEPADSNSELTLLRDATDAPELEAEVAEMNELLATAGTLELEADVWAAWWKQHRNEMGMVHRYRFGQPYSAAVVLSELSSPSTLFRARRVAARELSFLVQQLRLETSDWVARQRAELQLLSDGVR